MSEYNEDFKVICELFCHLAKELESSDNHDLAEIMDYLMSVWLERTLMK